jgi:methionyl-tRNA formyltransferase
LKIYRTSPSKGSGEPGEVIEAEGESLVVACGERAIEVKEIQREGKAKMSAEEFLRGYTFHPGDRLG